MQTSREVKQKQKQLQTRGCRALCCARRLSVSSFAEDESSINSRRVESVSTISHAMVQERLEEMIRERQENTRARREETKFIVMVAMEKCSYDPRQDFRESIEQMILANRIEEAKDLRRLLNYYVTMNSEEFRGVILEKYSRIFNYQVNLTAARQLNEKQAIIETIMNV
ncbi:probable transcription repressor OFP9 [Sesamum indicum]|uniref:Transcription repressor n=1 Tax=Sesamum indicum TaxID=4182 RepID=A0A8M8VC25_SESIN|nr:probable transcription repressor OFP9 [Sesamum indicum]